MTISRDARTATNNKASKPARYGVGYQPISSSGVVSCGIGPAGAQGVRENRGAGAAWSTPPVLITVPRAITWASAAASLHVNTGVTHASVPSKILVHSSRVLLANRWVKTSNILGYEPISNWPGTSSADNPRPDSNAAKNCGSMAPTAMYLPSAVS